MRRWPPRAFRSSRTGPSWTAGRSRVHKRCGSNAAAGTPDDPTGCFYFQIQGTLFVNANTSAAAVRFGLNDFSDAHNSAKIDRLIVNNAGPGWAVRLNYILNADIFAVAVSAGSVGLVMDQVQFSRISGAASATTGTPMLIERG